MSVIESVARLRVRKGLSVAEAARRSGLHASNLSAIEHGSREPTVRTLERAARAVGGRLLAVDTGGRYSASDIASAISRSLATGDAWGAPRWLVQLSDDLVAAPPFAKTLLAAEVPPSISAEWDAAIAGLVEWRLAEAGLPAPEWAVETAGDASRRWSPWPGEVVADPSEVPEPLLRRGVWIERGELASA